MATVTLGHPSPTAPPRIETARLVLRQWRDDDAAAYERLLRDRDVMRYLGSGARYRAKRVAADALARFSTLEARRALRNLRRHWDEHGFGEWAAEEKATGRLVGQIGLHHLPDWTAEPTRVEVGWLLMRDAWGRGLATEGGEASLREAFETVGLPRVISVAVVDNERSVRVMRRIGLEYVGHVRWRGSEMCWYALDREEWLRRRSTAS